MTGEYVNGKHMRQGDEKANNLKKNQTTKHKHKEMAGDVPFAGGTETLIHGPQRSSTYWNGSSTAVEVKQNWSTVETVTDFK